MQILNKPFLSHGETVIKGRMGLGSGMGVGICIHL